MDITDHVEALTSKLEGRRCSPAFPDRANVVYAAFREGGSLYYSKIRPLSAPVPSTDLGVRKFSELKIFYKHHCSIAKIAPLSTTSISQVLIKNPDNFGHQTDAVLTFFGDYTAVQAATHELKTHLLKVGNYYDLIQAGTVLAALSDPFSIQILERASEVAPTRSAAYGAQHRAAAAEIKRFNSPARGVQRLMENQKMLAVTQGQASLLNEAILLNLQALAESKTTGSTNALVLLGRARTSLLTAIESGELTPTEISMAARYASQVAINAAQLHTLNRDSQSAISILKESFTLTRSLTSEYFPEALIELSYAFYLDSQWPEAISLSYRSFGHFFHMGILGSISASRKVVAASLLELGREGDADFIAGLIESDPLGFEEFGDVY